MESRQRCAPHHGGCLFILLTSDEAIFCPEKGVLCPSPGQKLGSSEIALTVGEESADKPQVRNLADSVFTLPHELVLSNNSYKIEQYTFEPLPMP